MSTIELAAQIRHRFYAAVDAYVCLAIVEEYKGKIWAWVTIANEMANVHVTRTEPNWPLENVIGSISVWDLSVTRE